MTTVRRLTTIALIFALAPSVQAMARQVEDSSCRAVRRGDIVELCSPSFVFRLTTSNGLRAESWENRLTGRLIPLGNRPELSVDVGLPSEAVAGVQWLPAVAQPESDLQGEAVFELRAEEPGLSATVRYVWDADQPVLRKLTEIRNESKRELNRLLNICLGEYAPPAGTGLTNAGRGFPAYIDGEFFVSLAHPAGFAEVKDETVALRHYPGIRLAPGQKFQCMEAVYGVAPSRGVQEGFVRHVGRRMRRVLRGHDRPYAILESFGGQPGGDFWTREDYLLDHLAKVAQGLRAGGPAFDFYCTEFWHDPAGDLTTFHPRNFPGGYGKVRDEILRLGMRPGLWIDSGGVPAWTIGSNPAVRGCFTRGDGQGEICRASEPINTMYKKAFIRHIRENKVGLLKFDNLGPACRFPCCENPAHAHLPGPLYSVEAIHNAIIDFLRELDAADPDVFLMLYWGYRSPWWLEHADTYFENGAHIEAASPAEFPAPHARDSVTQRLDQVQSLILDTPWLGKDSLGLWLSDWPWNSCIGKSRWQEGFIMDLCRGSLLAQVWTDANWLTPAERRQLADFIALLRARPDCFGSSRLILGDPWKPEPYGYACGNGRRAFLAVHNACLEDRLVTLPIGRSCGLSGDGPWDIYRWYPHPARLKNSEDSPGPERHIALRPFEVVFLEVVPGGEEPSLGRTFDDAAFVTNFAESSRRLDLQVALKTRHEDDARPWHVLRPVSASAGKAELKILDDGSVLAGGENADGDIYTITADAELQSLGAVMLEALTDDSLPLRGPGRAINGNFTLTDLRVLVAPAGRPDEPKEIRFQAARTDFSQSTAGGWPAAAAIDGDATSGWSIHPRIGAAHAAIFELDTPIDMAGPVHLTFILVQGDRGHALGRFRLSVSTTKSPEFPAAFVPGELTARTQLTTSQSHGLLLLIGGRAMEQPRAMLADRILRLDPVWSDDAYWPCPWRAWRAQIDPGQTVRRLEITVETHPSSSPPSLEACLLPR